MRLMTLPAVRSATISVEAELISTYTDLVDSYRFYKKVRNADSILVRVVSRIMAGNDLAGGILRI